MDIKDAIYKRRSIRKFKDTKIQESDIDILLHYATSGPSACNKKPWQFYIVINHEKQQELRKVTRYSNIIAPLYIVVGGDTKRALKNEFWVQDCSAAIENILLGTVELELGACWIGVYPFKNAPQKVRDILEIDDTIIPMSIIAIGYPDEVKEPRDQYEASKVHYIR